MSASPPTQRFGKYQILERISAGGMAEVFKAQLQGEGGFQRTLAIKRVLPHLSQRPEFVAMLVEEAKIAGLLSHANIVQILDLGEVDGVCFVAMEYVDGPDLGRVLQRCREKGIALPVPHASFIAIEVLKALEYAHGRRVTRAGQDLPLDIVHRDISPANVLLSLQGEVKLTDFGIARASVKALETVAGVVKGRFDAMAPEQAAGRKADARADLFATGLLLYECLTGQHPFRKGTEGATLDAIRAGQFKPASQVNPDVPLALDHLLERALAVRPEDRPADATEMKAELERFFHDAGFLFTHSTLAAYLKGLFPELHRKKAPPPDRGDPTVQVEAARPVQRLNRPKGDPFAVGDSTARKAAQAAAARPPPALQDLPDLPDAPPPAGIGEEATLIRPPPPGTFASERPPMDPAEWGELATVIRPAPADTAPLQAAARSARPAPSPPRAAAPSAPAHAPASIAAARPGGGWLWPLLCLLTGTLALLLGLGLGRLGAPARPDGAPQLRVILPAEARLQLDGQLIERPSPIDLGLEAGARHRLRIELAGYAPFDTQLVLQPGEVRVLQFEAVPLSTPPGAPGRQRAAD